MGYKEYCQRDWGIPYDEMVKRCQDVADWFNQEWPVGFGLHTEVRICSDAIYIAMGGHALFDTENDHGGEDFTVEAIKEYCLDSVEDLQTFFNTVMSAARPSDHTPEGILAQLNEWCHTFGASLCPGSGNADTFGDGMRAAKRQVLNILTTRGGSGAQ